MRSSPSRTEARFPVPAMAAAMLVSCLGGCSMARPGDTPHGRKTHIQVSATCRQAFAPDGVRLLFGTTVAAAGAEEALKLSLEARERMREAFLRLGLPPDSHSPTRVEFEKVRLSGSEEILRARHLYRISFSPLDSLRPYLQILWRAGMNQVQDMEFELTRRDSLERVLRLAAVDSLQSRAEWLAAQMDLRLVRLAVLSYRPLAPVRPEEPRSPEKPIVPGGGHGGLDDLLGGLLGGDAAPIGAKAKGHLRPLPANLWPSFSTLPEELFRLNPAPISIERTVYARFEVRE